MATMTESAAMTAELVAAVRDFAETELAPHANQWDATKHFPLDTLRTAGQMGLGGVYVREDVGGSELSRLDAAAIFEELARGDITIAAYISIHNMVAWMIDHFGTDTQRHRWLPGLVTMEDLGAYCLTEPGAGSDAATLTTTAKPDGGGYVLKGVKQFISGAGAASTYVVMARTGEPGPKGISAFIVPADAQGLSVGAQEQKMGWNAQPTAQVMFDDVRLTSEHRLGGPGEGFAMAMKALNGGRLNIAATSLGGAQWAVDQAAGYVQEREAFGAPLAANQNIVFTLATAHTELQAARLLLQSAASTMDAATRDASAVGSSTGQDRSGEGSEEAVACAMAKRFATDVAFDAANAALQMHGGYGYLHEYGIERVVRDLRVHQILEGANEIMQMMIGREVLSKAKGHR